MAEYDDDAAADNMARELGITVDRLYPLIAICETAGMLLGVAPAEIAASILLADRYLPLDLDALRRDPDWLGEVAEILRRLDRKAGVLLDGYYPRCAAERVQQAREENKSRHFAERYGVKGTSFLSRGKSPKSTS